MLNNHYCHANALLHLEAVELKRLLSQEDTPGIIEKLDTYCDPELPGALELFGISDTDACLGGELIRQMRLVR